MNRWEWNFYFYQQCTRVHIKVIAHRSVHATLYTCYRAAAAAAGQASFCCCFYLRTLWALVDSHDARTWEIYAKMVSAGEGELRFSPNTVMPTGYGPCLSCNARKVAIMSSSKPKGSLLRKRAKVKKILDEVHPSLPPPPLFLLLRDRYFFFFYLYILVRNDAAH